MRISDGEYLEIINQNINLLIQDVRDLQAGQQRIEAKVDALRFVPKDTVNVERGKFTVSGGPNFSNTMGKTTGEAKT